MSAAGEEESRTADREPQRGSSGPGPGLATVHRFNVAAVWHVTTVLSIEYKVYYDDIYMHVHVQVQKAKTFRDF